MLFNKKEWKNRISEYPTRRNLVDSEGNTTVVTVERNEGNVEQEGDILNAENMNDLENRINTAFNNFPFDFGIDENGNCGFIKPGEDTVTPFGSGGGGTSRTVGTIENLQMAKITGLTSEVTVEPVTE